MSALSEKSRQELGKILGLLESNFEGERDAAIRAATRLLERHGLRWCEVLPPALTVLTVPPAAPPPVREPFPMWRATCAELAMRPGSLRQWERKFVADLPAFPRISAKQRRILDDIAARMLRKGAAA